MKEIFKSGSYFGELAKKAVPFKIHEFTAKRANEILHKNNSWLGKTVICPLLLRDMESNASYITIENAVASVSQTTHIVKTAIVGMPGTIKEFINTGDYDITLTIEIASETEEDTYPYKEVQNFVEMLNTGRAIGVSSDFLTGVFDIDKMVVERYQVQQETHKNSQCITVYCTSEREYEIQMVKN